MNFLFGGLIFWIAFCCAIENSENKDVEGFNYDEKIQDVPGFITFKTINDLNNKIRPRLISLINTDYFKYFRLNLYKGSCPFKNDEGICQNQACSVETIDDMDNIPEIWRPEILGAIEGAVVQQPDIVYHNEIYDDDEPSDLYDKFGESVEQSCIAEDNCGFSIYDNNKDYCLIDDFCDNKDSVYVCLTENPERYTGYNGRIIWSKLYAQNCFSGSDSNSLADGLAIDASVINAAIARSNLQDDLDSDIGNFISELSRSTGLSSDHVEVEVLDPELASALQQQPCMERRVFYKLISGMHASISTHLCNEYLNVSSGKWEPNSQCFFERVGNHSDRLQNLFFNYALVARALTKLQNYIEDYTFCAGDSGYDRATRLRMSQICSLLDNDNIPLFNENSLFTNLNDGKYLRNEFRSRFFNISRIMDCVTCDKCRLWGKLQVMGYGTALKILFDFPNGNSNDNYYQDPSSLHSSSKTLLRRTEIVALMNTMDRLSKSVAAVQYFMNPDMIRPVWEENLQDNKNKNKNKNKTDRGENDSENAKDDSIIGAFKTEWAHTLEAIHYIFFSWIYFPYNLWKLFSMYFTQWWYNFLGSNNHISMRMHDEF